MVAGGAGRRARAPGDTELKQFRALVGKPLISWSIRALTDAGCAPLIVAVPAGTSPHVRGLIGDGPVLVDGGTTRRDSVRNCLDHVDTDRVVVHDAARPLLGSDLVLAVVTALDEMDAAIPAVPIGETIKRVEGDRVLETLDRSGLWTAQTPQAFRTEILKRAHAHVGDAAVTDDAQLVEAVGGRVTVVPGHPSNIKITNREDFDLAEAILRSKR